MTEFKKIGVIGAGTMGSGITFFFLKKGLKVTLVDHSMQNISKTEDYVKHHLNALETKGKLSKENKSKALASLSVSQQVHALHDSDLVIEAVTEKEDVKLKVFKELSESINKDAVIASNTSSISITKLASAIKNPENFLGLHFMNPAPVMKLVEVVKGLKTSKETLNKSVTFLKGLGKTPVTVNDSPGFVSNRLLGPMINEAVYLLQEGVASKKDIDAITTLGFNHPMGPLELADFIGLDVCLDIMEKLHADIGDDKYRPCPLLREMVSAGLLGKKTLKGFYEYNERGGRK